MRRSWVRESSASERFAWSKSRAFLSTTRPHVIAPAIMNVPASIRSGITVCSAPRSFATPSITIRGVLERRRLELEHDTIITIQGLGQLIPGVTFNQPDVGGSRAMQQTYFFVRGTGSAQTIVMVTHDPRAAERARVVLHLDKGVLVEGVRKGSDA